MPYIFINDYDIVEESKDIEVNKEPTTDPYEEMGDLIQLDDNDLPF